MSDDDKACDPTESELFEVVEGIPESKHMEFFFSAKENNKPMPSVVTREKGELVEIDDAVQCEKTSVALNSEEEKND